MVGESTEEERERDGRGRKKERKKERDQQRGRSGNPRCKEGMLVHWTHALG